MMRNSYPSRRRSSHDWQFLIIGGIVALMFVVAIGGVIAFYSASSNTITCKVENKDRASNGDGGSDMRLYTEDCDVLSVADVLFVQWDSASVYNDIDAGKSYEFKTLGWRIPFLSMFPTVVESKEVS